LIGYRLLGFWRDKDILDKLADAEPSLGFTGASWAAPDLRGLKQNSVLMQPRVWRVVYPLFSRVGSVYFRGTADADLERCRGLLDRFSHPFSLELDSDEITDSGLEVVARVKNLSGLTLYSNGRISDAGVARLHSLPILKVFRLILAH
jgi:hypothetical protein